ncbi:beta-ketoacyl synthase N-terminal-like domain-containing protein [Nocardia sp. CA-135953]|uniref:beta-ketoacyl synthase N-terminal-like domain-containing protein n=1 Tax=Nocardia sp. CA-135953 TaxID=3239978 RepID=UPI003D985E53
MTATLAITGWSVLSPYGPDRDAFTRGLTERRCALRAVRDEEGLPHARVGAIDTFETRAHLGRKGTRAMDRATGLAVATVGMILAARTIEPADTALVLGTTTGSARSMMEFTRDSLTEDKPYHVDPARFPNTVMNCAAGQCAIWHGLTGPNTTISSGRGTLLAALNYAERLHRNGHTERVLCGAVEELSEHRAWLEWHGTADPARRTEALSEGCAMFLLEPAARAEADGGAVYAEILAVTFRRGAPEQRRDSAATAIRACLDRAGIAPEQVWALAIEDDIDSVASVFGTHTDALRHLPIAELLGDLGAVSAGMQLAAVLAHARADERGRAAVVATTDPDGAATALVLRLGNPR